MSTQTVKFKGEFDVSSILNSIKQMRTELAKSGNSSLFGNLDKEISKIETLGSTIKAQMEKGFASNKEFKAFESNINKLELSIQKIGQNFNNVSADNLKNALKKIDADTEKIAEKAKEAAAVFKEQLNKDMGNIGKVAKEVNKEIAQMASEGRKYEDAEKRVLEVYNEKLTKIRQQLEIEREAIKLAKENQSVSREGLNRDVFYMRGQRKSQGVDDTTFSKIEVAWDSAIKGAKNASEAARQFNAELDKLNVRKNGKQGTRDAIMQSFTEYSKAIASTNPAIVEHEKEIKKLGKAETELVTEQSRYIANLASEREAYESTANAARANSTAEESAARAKNQARAVTEQESAAINALGNNLQRTTNELRQEASTTSEAVKSQDRLNTSLDSLKTRIAYVFSLGNAYYQLRRMLQNTLTDVENIDKAFASIAMVTDKTVSGLWEHYGEYAAMAQKLGQSTESAIKASALFYQQGLKDAEVMQLTEETMKLATLAGLDFEKATSQMTAALRGFHMEMDQGAHVTDVYSELAAHAAADVNGIAYAMSKTASIANNAGMAFETTAAFLTQMIETTQEAPENIGTAMKTIIARFTELKKNVAGTAESEFEDLDYNKVDTALKSVGVQLKDTNGQFRNLDEVFLELSEKWNTLDRNSQRYIATIAAGSRQQSRFIAMMENYERTLELVNITQDAEGRSNEQFAKNAESLTFKIQELKTAWEQFRMSIADSKFFKNVVDILKDFINTLNKMDKKQLVTVGLIGITIGKSIIKNFVDTIRGSSGEIQAAWKQAMAPTLKERFGAEGRQNRADFYKSQWARNTEETDPVRQELVKYDELNAKLREQENLLKEIHRQKALCKDKATEEYNVLMQQGQEQAKQVVSTRDELNTEIDLINKKLKDLGIEQQITKENRQQINAKLNQKDGLAPGVSAIKSGVTNGISAGITTALMMAISGADFGTIIKTAGTTALMAAIPSILQAIMPTLITFFTGPAGIITLVLAGAIALTATIISDSQKAEEAERKRLENVKKLNDKISDDIKKTLSNLDSTTRKEDKIKKDTNIINALNSKKFLNSKEEKELETAVNELNSIEDGMVEFDEVTGHYKIVESKMDDILEAIDHEKMFARGTANVGRIRQLENINDRAIAREHEYLTNIEGNRWKTSDQAWAADITQYNTITDTYGNKFKEYDLSAYGIAGTVKEFLDQINDRYKDYGVHLDEFFGGKGLEEILDDRYPDSSEISQYFQDNNINAQNISEILEKIHTKVEEIDSIESKKVNGEFVENALRTQGWSEDVASVAKYMEGYAAYEGKTKGERIFDSGYNNANGHLFAFGDNKDFLTDLKQGNWDIFGDNADLVKKLFTEKYEISDMSSLFSSGTNLKNLGEMGKFGDALSGFVDDSDWNGPFGDRKTAKEEVKAIKKLLAAEFVERSELLAKQYQETLDANKDNFIDFMAIVQDTDDKTWAEYSKGVNDFKDKQIDTVKNAMADYLSAEEDNIYKTWSTTISEISKAGISTKILEKLDYKTLTYFAQQIKDLNLSTNALSEYVGYINTAFKDLDSKVLNVLANIDTNNINNLTAEETQKYVDLLTNITGDATKAQDILNDYIAEMSRLLMKAGQGSDQADLFVEITEQSIKGYSEQYETLLKAQAEYQEKGLLSEKTYFELKEAGFNNYIKVTSKGYELLAEKSEEYLTKRALEPLRNLQKEIQNQEAFIEAAESQKKVSFSGRNFTSFYRADDIQRITGKENSLDDSDLVKLYKEDVHLFDAFAEYWGLSQEYIYAIELAARNGAENIADFTQKAREYKSELLGKQEQVYIQSLISLKEAYEETTNKVQELKDKIKELNETLEKNKETLDEAVQKLYEAQHGTELFQSSLDGLTNYNSKLTQTNNIIEDLKDNLEDIDNIDSGKDVLSSLSSAYDSKTANYSAQNVVINDALNNLKSTMLDKYGDFIKFEGDNPLVDFSYLNMDANDEIRKAFEKEYQEYENYLNKRRTNNKEIKNLNKERENFEKDSLKDYVSIQKDVIDILKDQAKEEVDITKEKYEALKDADNDYINALEDAIQKQRELRERENSEEELAQKEKKLSLMSRDTSGANAKDILKLEKEVTDDREKLLDDNIDAVINDMKELYEKQAEARDAEIEYMESVTENAQYFNEWAQNIMASWESIDDMQDWFLSNDSNVQDMTVEQTEQYIDDIQSKWTDLITYQSLKVTDFKANTENINAEMTNLYNTTSENISSVGTNIQLVAEKAAQDAEKAAQKARDEAQKTYNDTLQKINDAQKELRTAEATAADEHKAIVKEMVEATKSGFKDVSVYAVQQLAELQGVDLTDKKAAEKFAIENNWKNSKGQYSESFRQAVQNAGGDMNDYLSTAKYKVMVVTPNSNSVPGMVGSLYNSEADAQAAAQRLNGTNNGNKYFVQKDDGREYGQITGLWRIVDPADNILKEGFQTKEEAQKYAREQAAKGNSKYDIAYYQKYKTGGLVPYTGIAQVDGSPSRPEAFLSAEDTQRFLTAAELFAMSPLLNSASAQNAVSSSIGDTSIEININVESISDDYDVDRLIKRVEDDINETARPVGTQVILNKRV